MIKNEYIAPHILKLYVWELLKANIGWTTVNGLTRIVPSEDEPKLADTGSSYIIYGWSETMTTNLAEHRRGVFSMRIIAKTSDEVTEILNTISVAFQDENASAESVNWFSTNFPVDLEGIRFTNLSPTYIESAGPPTTEGGRQEGVISIAYRYVTNQDVKTYQNVNGQWVWV